MVRFCDKTKRGFILLCAFSFSAQLFGAVEQPVTSHRRCRALIEALLGEREFVSPVTSFQKGDFVQVGMFSDPRLVAFPKCGPKNRILSKKATLQLPLIGRYVDRLSDGSVVIDLGNEGQIVVSQIPLVATPRGSESKLRQFLAHALSIHLSFAPNETIRFRNSHGEMIEGTIKTINNADAEIEYQDPSLKKVSHARVNLDDLFKKTNPRAPSTPIYGLYAAELADHHGVLVSVLDSSAKLTSTQSYMHLSPIEKVIFLQEYVRRILEVPESVQIMAHFDGRQGFEFSDVMCVGYGVCRHLSPLLGTMLGEAGFEVRSYVRFITNEDGTVVGHNWLEISMIDEKWKPEIYIVDPMVANSPLTLDQAKELTRQDPTSESALYYTHPQKLQLLPEKPK